jgi:hypothetical protein
MRKVPLQRDVASLEWKLLTLSSVTPPMWRRVFGLLRHESNDGSACFRASNVCQRLAQDPVKTDSDKYKILLENERVRVLEYRVSQKKKPQRMRIRTLWFWRAVLLNGN